MHLFTHLTDIYKSIAQKLEKLFQFVIGFDLIFDRVNGIGADQTWWCIEFNEKCQNNSFLHSIYPAKIIIKLNFMYTHYTHTHVPTPFIEKKKPPTHTQTQKKKHTQKGILYEYMSWRWSALWEIAHKFIHEEIPNWKHGD